MTTTPKGREEEAGVDVEVEMVVDTEGGDLRRDLTTSLTPRLRHLALAAGWGEKSGLEWLAFLSNIF